MSGILSNRDMLHEDIDVLGSWEIGVLAQNRRSRTIGALLGVTIGDTLGAPLEFKSAEMIEQQWGVHREIEGVGTFGHPAGVGTDDSDMTFAVARAYKDGFTLDKVAANFIAWKDSGPRDIGGATASGIGRLRTLRSSGSTDLTQAGGTDERSCGNGSLMRAVAVGLAQPDDVARSRQAIDISALTHAHPRCTEACALYADLISRLVDGESPETAFKYAISCWYVRNGAMTPQSLHYNEALLAFERGWDTAESSSSPDAGLSELGTTGYVLDGLTLATWALRRSLDVDPSEALIEVVNRGGDADTNGAIVGGVLGAANDVSVWPLRWINKVSYRDEAFEVGEVLDEIRENTPIESITPPPHPKRGDSYKSDGPDLSERSPRSGLLEISDIYGHHGDTSSTSVEENEVPRPSYFRRLFGMKSKTGKARPLRNATPSALTMEHRQLCGKWMPRAKKPCVLPSGHSRIVHHRSVLN